MLTALNLMPWVLRNIQWIALGLALLVGGLTLYNWGVSNERAKWEAEAAKQQEALRQALSDTREEGRRLEAEVDGIIAKRAALLEELRNEALDQVGSDTVCIPPDGMRSLAASLERLRSGTGPE